MVNSRLINICKSRNLSQLQMAKKVAMEQTTYSRNNNKGWRIDYNMVAEPLKDNLKRAVILSKVMHSDHCPLLVELEF